MIYLDAITEKDARGHERIMGAHMAADTLAELHAFARSIDLKREWFQDHPRHPHYDLTTARARQRAIDVAGKRTGLVTTRVLVERALEMTRKEQDDND